MGFRFWDDPTLSFLLEASLLLLAVADFRLSAARDVERPAFGGGPDCHRTSVGVVLEPATPERNIRMKTSIRLLVVGFAISMSATSSTASAQDVCPEFKNSISVISEDGKSGKELSPERAIAKQKKKGIYRGYDNSVRLEGAEAKLAVKPVQKFAFKPIDPEVHPSQQIKLYPFKGEKSYRELVVGGVNTFGGSKNRKSGDNSIALNFKKIKDGCYEVSTEAPLPAGDYAFSLGGQGSSADVKGTSAGYGSSTQGQTWFGFAVK